MMQISQLLIFFLIFLNFSCKNAIQEVEYNGVYEENDNGKLFISSSDSNIKVRVKSNPILRFDEFKVINLSKILFDSGYVLNITLQDTSIQKFGTISEKNINKRLPIIIKNQLVFAPLVKTKISGGLFQLMFSDNKILNDLKNYFKDKITESKNLLDILDEINK